MLGEKIYTLTNVCVRAHARARARTHTHTNTKSWKRRIFSVDGMKKYALRYTQKCMYSCTYIMYIVIE